MAIGAVIGLLSKAASAMGKVAAIKSKVGAIKGAATEKIMSQAIGSIGGKGGGKGQPEIKAEKAELPQVQGDILGQGKQQPGQPTARTRPYFMTDDGQGGFRMKEFNDYVTDYLGDNNG